MDGHSRRPFSEQSALCLRRFQEVEDEIRRPNDLHLNMPVSLISDEMARFRRWIGIIRAVYIPSQPYASLDDREMPACTAGVMERVLEFLEDIAEDLDGGKPSSNSMMDVSLILLVLQITSGRMPNRVSSTEIDESFETLYEIHELFETCQDYMTCIFRISSAIPTITSSERYELLAYLALQREDQDDQLLDIAFVQQKFPKLRATPWLEKRLGLAVTIRREFVRGSKELHIPILSDIHVGSQVFVPPEERKFNENKQLAVLFSEAHCSREARSCSTYDESTTPDIAGLAISGEPNESKFPDAPQGISESISETAEASLSPLFPKEGAEGAQFYCPYCWAIMSYRGTAEQTQELWK